MRIANPFRRQARDDAPAPAVPANTRVYAVGDIHGRSDLLRSLHRLIAEDAARAPEDEKIVIYLGDYIDRGLDSRGVLDLLIDKTPEGVTPIHLKGNHEATLLRFLDDPSVGEAWIAFGGAETLYSYGVARATFASDRRALDKARLRLIENFPARHRAFLEGLKPTHRIGDYLFVHAGIRPGVPLDEQDEDDLLWIREEFLRSTVDYGCVVVHGHSIRREVEFRPNRIDVDTGAFASGVLTALVLAGSRRELLQTGRAIAA